MVVRGIRGATVVESDMVSEVIEATKMLLMEIQKANPTLTHEDIASILFTVTEDINSTFPAKAARELGWNNVPLMCAKEIEVPNAIPHCIRVLLHWNTDLNQTQITHVYLGEAKKLRPDLLEK
jgi:chorismate mutase